jgi:hypothetical protein
VGWQWTVSRVAGMGDVVVASGWQVATEVNINILNINLNFFALKALNY